MSKAQEEHEAQASGFTATLWKFYGVIYMVCIFIESYLVDLLFKK